jgi:two-component system phosphate regulon sensor histidine kinase PhoR
VILILTQIIWIQRANALRQDNFRQNVQKSLKEVISQLEIQENFETLLKSAQASNKKNDVINIENIQPTPKSYPENAFETDNFSLDYQDLSSNNIVYSRDTTRYILEQIFADSTITKDRKFLAKFFEETQKRRKKSLAERINYVQLDSLIFNILQQNGVTTGYSYEIVPAHRSYVAQLEKINLNDKTTRYAAQLFPQDYLDTYHYLVIEFDNENLYFLRGGTGLLLLSILSLLLVGVGAYYLYDTIQKQEMLSEIKNDFVNNMTHELKTPIATIALASEAMMNSGAQLSEKSLGRFTKIIYDENQRLKQNVERILDTAKMERGGVQLNITTIDIHQIIALALAQLDIQLKAKNTQIKQQLNATQAHTKGDEMHLTNLIFNIIDNAIKYSKPNEILHLEITTHNKFKQIIIEIKDNGIGMNLTQQKRIFEKFYRVHTGDVHNVKGFGIGLSYCKSVVEKHNGNITLSSQPNKGTTFKIELPSKKEEITRQKNENRNENKEDNKNHIN